MSGKIELPKRKYQEKMASWRQRGGPGALGNNLLAIKQIRGNWDNSKPVSEAHLGSEKLAVFNSGQAGLTAGIKNLITQLFGKNPTKTISDLVDRYLPNASTGEQENYKDRVASAVGIAKDATIEVHDFSALIDGIAIVENGIRENEHIEDYYGPNYGKDKKLAVDAAIAWHARPASKLFTKSAKDEIKQLTLPELPPQPRLPEEYIETPQPPPQPTLRESSTQYFPGQASPVTTPQRPPGLPSFEAARQTGQNNPFKLKGIGETGEEELIDFGDIYDGAKQFVNEILALVRKNETISGIVKAWHRLNN